MSLSLDTTMDYMYDDKESEPAVATIDTDCPYGGSDWSCTACRLRLATRCHKGAPG